MAGFAGLVLRVALALSLAALPWTQSWAMALAGETPATACHAADQAPDTDSSQPQAGACCETVHCHCLGAAALPAAILIGPATSQARWAAWAPAQPVDPDFAPTPPPPRA